MRTQRECYSRKPIVYTFELDTCLECGGPLSAAYTSGSKTVQTMGGVMTIAHRPQYCQNLRCKRQQIVSPSFRKIEQ